MIRDVVWWCVVCVIVVLCAGSLGVGSGQPAQRRRRTQEVETKREGEAVS